MSTVTKPVRSRDGHECVVVTPVSLRSGDEEVSVPAGETLACGSHGPMETVAVWRYLSGRLYCGLAAVRRES